ncbi:DUF1572 family protein [Chitinophaga tropicalis]|uniref:DUF1572 domain-containing protein n=1 Tax=Chitinophaga tropicalis TaxID=2683588 RepID=A0A7K1U451_9BACT|nr:DUF1572 family protein [Chitinophaga tropicalis]MVT09137.1 DUF1572 domain-containing protein [Chitinophaga tropicalis]
MQTVLKQLFQRDLLKLKTEISAYQHEQNIWIIDGNIANSAGNLCLHLVGNLNTFIGAELGHSGYIRNREEEFSKKDVPRSELLQMIDGAISIIEKTLDALPAHKLEEEYPKVVFESKMSTAYFLTHLAMHLAYHLGQINYHRRLLDK